MQKYYPSSPQDESVGDQPSQPPPYEDANPNRFQSVSPQPILAQPVRSAFPPSRFVRGQNTALNVPLGLEYLARQNRIFIKQEIELLDVLCGCCWPEKRYKIKDSRGQVIFRAEDHTDGCTLPCCSAPQPFELSIKDLRGLEAIHLFRPRLCQFCCCPCCLEKLDVFAPPGRLAGTVEQEWSCDPHFVVKDARGNARLRIVGPMSTCISWDFKIMSLDMQQVGRITKQWSGFARELFTHAGKFEIEFPRGLDVKLKAVLVGACFLIDFMYYEK